MEALSDEEGKEEGIENDDAEATHQAADYHWSEDVSLGKGNCPNGRSIAAAAWQQQSSALNRKNQ